MGAADALLDVTTEDSLSDDFKQNGRHEKGCSVLQTAGQGRCPEASVSEGLKQSELSKQHGEEGGLSDRSHIVWTRSHWQVSRR